MLGVALAGVSTPPAEIALDYCKRLGVSTEASIWGTHAKASVSTAAFANGLLAHALDFDDWDAFIHVGHPTSMLIGAALPLAEKIGASGKDLLKAYVLGIEVICKVAANCPNVQDRGFHSTPVFGSLGAAIACASLLKLDAAKLKAALGITASAAGGIHRQQGSMVKPFHAGNAARNGAEAALLAQEGFTADAAIIEAPRGFCDTFFGPGNCDYEEMIANLGTPYFLESPGMGLKWHPVQRAAVSCRRRGAASEARAQYPLRRHREDGSQYSAHALSAPLRRLKSKPVCAASSRSTTSSPCAS